MKSSNKTICLKALVVLSLLSLGSYASAEEYTWETPTFNDWKVMQLSGNQVLPHDALIGNNGTSVGPVPTAIFTKSGEKLELSSENNGKLQVIVRPKPNATPHWLYGIYNYASTTDTTPQQTTELVVKSQLGVDLESAKTQYPGYEELAKAIEVRARGHQAGSPGNNAVSKASFLEDVGIKVVNKTEGAKSPYPTADAVMGLALAGFDGGVVDVSFKKNLSIEGHAETNKNVYGLHMNDQGANGIGSKLSLGGNTFINVASEHGGRAVGMLALAHEANQTITMAETGSLVVKAKQAEGQNFSEAIKFIARGSAGKMSKQHATFGGGVSATANGAYYAVGVGAEVTNGSTQNLTFEKGLISSVTANDYSYALKLDGKNAGSDSQVVVKHRLDLMASSTNSSYGIHGETTSGAKNTLIVEGPATITAAHRENGKYAFGIYSKATTGGVRKISFNNGLTAKASSNTVSSPTVLYTKTDSVQGSVSEIVVDGEGTLYWNRYELDKKETADTTGAFTIDWYLKKVIPQLDPTTSVETIPAAGALNYYTWRNEFDKLLKRMGELRHNGELEEGVWARVKGAKIGSEQEPGFTNKYIHYEVGYDRLAKLDEKSKRYEGVALAYTDGTSTYRRGDGKNHSLAISFYNTDIRESGHYLDIVCKLSEMNNNFSVFDTKGKNITGETDNLGISLSAEYGRKKDLNHGWYVEPQTQLTLGYLGGDNYTTSNGIHVSQHGIKSAVARIGFNVGKEINDKAIIYAKMNLLHEFGGNYVVDMADSRVKRSLSKDFRDTWLEYGIGAAFALGEGTHAYCDVERSTGSDFNKEWEWNVGIRRNF